MSTFCRRRLVTEIHHQNITSSNKRLKFTEFLWQRNWGIKHCLSHCRSKKGISRESSHFRCIQQEFKCFVFFILFSLQYSFHPSSSIGIYLFLSFKYWKFYIAACLLHNIKGCSQPSNQNFQTTTFIKLLDGPFSECHLWVGYTHMYYFNVRCPNQEWIMDRPSIYLHTHQTHSDMSQQYTC
jgi:hypothetical protein